MEKQVDLEVAVPVKMATQQELVVQQQVVKVLQEALVYLADHIVVAVVVAFIFPCSHRENWRTILANATSN